MFAVDIPHKRREHTEDCHLLLSQKANPSPSPLTPRCASLRGGAGGGSSRSDHRRAVAEEEGERDGVCSGSTVGIDRASSHVLSLSREGGRGGAGGGGGGGSTSSDASGRVGP
jgi:hypothetical protein